MNKAIVFASAAIAMSGWAVFEARASDSSEAAAPELMLASGAGVQASSGPNPLPGRYEVVMTLGAIEGLPGPGGGDTVHRVDYCISPAEAREGYRSLMMRGQQGSCRYEQFTQSGTRIDAVAVCDTGPTTARVTIGGTVTENSADLDGHMTSVIPGLGTMRMEMAAVHRRTGSC